MNAHASIDPTRILVYEIDPEIKKLLLSMKKAARWRIWPYGWWLECDGSYIIFDRCYRPICRKRPTGSVEIVSPDQAIAFIDQGYIYSDMTHPDLSRQTAYRVVSAVQRLGIRSEIARRRRLARKRSLPRLDFAPVASRY